MGPGGSGWGKAGMGCLWSVPGERAVSAEALGYVGQPCMVLRGEAGRELSCYESPILLTVLPMTVFPEHSARVCNCFPLVWDDSQMLSDPSPGPLPFSSFTGSTDSCSTIEACAPSVGLF